MNGTTDDPTDPRLGRGVDHEGGHDQNDVYLVLSDVERARGFVRPVRRSYIHDKCGAVTTMGHAIAQTMTTCAFHRAMNNYDPHPDELLDLLNRGPRWRILGIDPNGTPSLQPERAQP